MTPQKPTIEERFEKLAKDIKATLSVGLVAIGMIVALEGGIIIWMLGVQNESVKDRSVINKTLDTIEGDFGTFLYILPRVTIFNPGGYDYAWESLTKKYNTKRGQFEYLEQPQKSTVK